MSQLSPRPANDITTFNFSKASVLLVDANEATLDVMMQILAGFGFRKFHRCSDLEAGAEMVADVELDLILIDTYRCEDAAFDFIRELRAERLGGNARAPVVLITGHAQLDQIRRAAECGASFVVVKPFVPSTLLERILWVAKSQARREPLSAHPAPMTPARSGAESW